MKFKDALTENKKRKYLRDSGEIAKESKTERKWKVNEVTNSSLPELKTGRLVLTDKL